MTIALVASVGNRMMINLREVIVRRGMPSELPGNSFGKSGVELMNLSSVRVGNSTNNNGQQSELSMPVVVA